MGLQGQEQILCYMPQVPLQGKRPESGRTKGGNTMKNKTQLKLMCWPMAVLFSYMLWIMRTEPIAIVLLGGPIIWLIMTPYQLTRFSDEKEEKER